MEAHRLGVIEDAEEMGLNGVRVAGLTQNLQQRRVGHKEESREGQTLLLQVTVSNRNQWLIFRRGSERNQWSEKNHWLIFDKGQRWLIFDKGQRGTTGLYLTRVREEPLAYI